MKRILITGANSYVGTAVEKWLHKTPERFTVDTLDMIGEAWKEKDFSNYDVVFHVAGIAHVDVDSHAAESTKKLYYDVNYRLAVEVAKKAKEASVSQFIFMSSMMVYGDSGGVGKKRVIGIKTKPSPSNFYGNSKWQADKAVQGLANHDFKVVVLRPPMIYGKGSKGNYEMLSKLARKLPIFPEIDNQRSMLYIENLCEFIRLMIENEESGVFFPQNKEYCNTSEMVKIIAKIHGKKMIFLRILGIFVIIISRLPLGKISCLANKAFGNMVYEMSLSGYKTNYHVCKLKKSLERTESFSI